MTEVVVAVLVTAGAILVIGSLVAESLNLRAPSVRVWWAQERRHVAAAGGMIVATSTCWLAVGGLLSIPVIVIECIALVALFGVLLWDRADRQRRL